MLRRVLLVTGLALALSAGAAGAQAPASTPADRLAAAVQDVGHATAVRYAAADDHNAPLDGLKVIQTHGTNVGVYHAPSGAGRFSLFVATSTDLLHWTRRATLATDSSQGTLTALPDGGYLVAYEWANLADLVPRLGVPSLALPKPLDRITPLQQAVVTLDRTAVRFRHYPSLARLLAGRRGRQFTAPRQLSASAQGTPSISAVSPGRDLAHSRIEVGLHYRADTDANGFPDDDRQATGVLTNFSSWSSQVATDLNSAFATVTDLHAPYTAPPRGSFGDRDPIVFDGARLALHEVQYDRTDFASWRPFLVDPAGGAPRAVRMSTPGASTSFGNPTVTELRSPAGRRALLVTMFVFGEGAAPGEAGPLVYYREL